MAEAATGNIITMVAGYTDVGMVRTNNEDNFLISDLATGRVYLIPQRITHKTDENRVLLAVSDGVGGASAGEVASSMAVHSMRVELTRRNVGSASPFDRLVQAVEKANTLIWNEGQSNPERRGMGATITAALIEKNVVYIAEVGDSRGYAIHNGRIKQITTDQSLVGILVNRGLMTPEQAETAPGRNIILQSLGCQAEVKVAVTSLELTAGDYLLLCSDGLSGKVKDDEMLKMVLGSESVEDSCRKLIDLAKQRGGEDNITVIVARFEGDGMKPSDNVPRLTTNIEVLSAFDPDGKSSRPTSASTNQVNAAKTNPVQPQPQLQNMLEQDTVRTSTAQVQAAVNEENRTKKLSSEQSASPTIYTQTLGNNTAPIPQEAAELVQQQTLRVEPVKYSADQLAAFNNATSLQLNALINALRQQVEAYRNLIFWAQRDGKDTSAVAEAFQRLEQLLKMVESQPFTAADAEQLLTKLSNQ